jgi:hypothetical protein
MIAQYVICRSLNDGTYKAIGVQRYGVNRYVDSVNYDAKFESLVGGINSDCRPTTRNDRDLRSALNE